MAPAVENIGMTAGLPPQHTNSRRQTNSKINDGKSSYA